MEDKFYWLETLEPQPSALVNGSKCEYNRA